MRRKKIIEAAVVCILLLLLGAYMEFSDRSMDDCEFPYKSRVMAT